MSWGCVVITWQREPLAALSPGKDAVVELSQGLLNKVIAQQANPVGTVSGSAHYDDNDPRVAIVFGVNHAHAVGVVVGKSSPQIILHGEMGKIGRGSVLVTEAGVRPARGFSTAGEASTGWWARAMPRC